MNNKDDFLKHYANLSNPDKNVSQNANQYILQLQRSDEAYSIAQQILDSQSPLDHQFIACQLILTRIKDTYNPSVQQYLQILLQRELPPIALYQICSAFAIVIIEEKQQWSRILDDLLLLMQNKLIVGLNILTEIAIQIKEIPLMTKRMQLQTAFKMQKDKIFVLLLQLLQITDINIIHQVLKCMEAWVEIQLPIFENQLLVTQLMNLTKQGMNSNAIEFIGQIFDLFTQSIIHSEYIGQNNLATQNKGVHSILLTFMQFLLEIFHINLPQQYAILCTKFACEFKGMYLNTEYEPHIFQLMVTLTCLDSRKISYQTFQFWTEMKAASKLNENGVIMLQSLINKCKLKSTLVTREFLSGENEEKEPGDAFSAYDYREYVRDILFTIFSEADYNNKQKFFEVIISNLKLNDSGDQNQQVIQCEAAIFAAQAIMDNFQIEKYESHVEQIANFILTLPAEGTDIIAKTSLCLFNEFDTHYKFKPYLFDRVVGYTLRYMSHPKLGSLAATAFDAISIQVTSVDPSVLNQCLDYLEINWMYLTSQTQMENCISGILNLCNLNYNQTAMIRLLSFVDAQFKTLNPTLASNQMNLIINLVLAPLNWFNLHYEEIPPAIKCLPAQLSQSISAPLISSIHHFKDNEFFEKILMLFRIIIRVSDYQTQVASIEQILNLALQIFSLDPIRKSNWLSIVTTIISRSDQNNYILQWAANNLHQIHTFCLEQHKHWNDADLIKYYAELLRECVGRDPNILLTSPLIAGILSTICQALLDINNYEMQREVFLFLKAYCMHCPGDNQTFQQSLTLIIAKIFEGAHLLNPALLTNIQHIMIYTANKYSNSEVLEQYVKAGLSINWGQNKQQNQLSLVARAIIFYSYNTQVGQINRQFKLLLSNLNPCCESEMNYMQLELQLRNK